MHDRMKPALRSSRAALLVHVALASVIAAGLYVRFVGLSGADLTLEELTHLYVGRALGERNEPVLPSGAWYDRGLEYSRLTAWAGRALDPPELAQRLPSAVFGGLAVVAVAGGTYAVAGPLAALCATLLFAFHPDSVMQARTGRFYSIQVLAGVIALFAGWVVVGRSPSGSRREWGAAWAAAGLACLALAAAARTQVTTLPTVLAFWLFLAGVGVRDVRALGPEAWRRSVPLGLAAFTAAAAVLLLVAFPAVPVLLAMRALSTPYWARATDTSPLLYYESLATWYPGILLVGAASFGYLMRRRPRLGAYLLTMFLVPAAALSLLPFRASRFMLLAVPPLMVAIGAAVATAAEALVAERAEGAGSPRTRARRSGPALGGATLALLLAVPVLMAAPALVRGAIGYHRIPTPGWRAAAALLGARPELAGVPLGSTRSLPAAFYWGKVDFSVSIGHLEQWGTALGVVASDPAAGAYMTSAPGTPDMYAGVPVLPTPESIRTRFAGAGLVLIAVDEPSLGNRMVDESLLSTLEGEAEELCAGRCGTLRLFLWSVGGEPRVEAPRAADGG
jgi:hypothetical protein